MQLRPALTVVAIAVAALSLTACHKPASETASVPSADGRSGETTPDQAAAAPGTDVPTASPTSAQTDCIAATAEEVGVEASAVAFERREGSRLYMRVEGAEGAWWCDLDPQGQVGKVWYSGAGEGAL